MKETHMREADSLRLRDVQAAVATGAIPTNLKITISAWFVVSAVQVDCWLFLFGNNHDAGLRRAIAFIC